MQALDLRVQRLARRLGRRERWLQLLPAKDLTLMTYRGTSPPTFR
jgi:hypothetical protein